MNRKHDRDSIPNPLDSAPEAAGHSDGVDRRGFLKCMAWAGTGVVWTLAGGVLSSCALPLPQAASQGTGDFSFVQVSDSHIGFKAIPNMDVTGTFQKAINDIGALKTRPSFILHTGDVSHLSAPDQYDTVDQIVKASKISQAYYVPGEHDTFVDNGQAYLSRFGTGTAGNGWRSFDYNGVHFVGLINVWNLKSGGFGVLGQDQLDWLHNDVAPLSASTPIVVYAHVPLWALYPTWGWGTTDAEQALTELRRFGSVTVLNGHVHQVLQKIEGNVTFHTAAGTAYPQPAPGTAPAPGPLLVVSDQLMSTLGIREVAFIQKAGAPVIVDSQLS